MTEPLLSACLIVKDEEANLPRCLASIRGLHDDLVVVDTGSTDATISIARDFGARVFEVPWRNDFAWARNVSLDHGLGQWLMPLDADDELVDTDIAETRARLASGDLDSDVLLGKNRLRYAGGREMTLLAPRLIRRASGFRYTHAVHEQLDTPPGTPAGVSNLTFLHHGYLTREMLERKERRNLAIAETMPPSAHAMHCVLRSAFFLGDWRRTVATAMELAALSDANVTLREDACALGAAASVSVKDPSALTHFLSVGQALSPDNPDLRLMGVIAALFRYVHTLKDGDSTEGGQHYVRPWLYWHDKSFAQAVLGTLLGGTARESSTDGTGEETTP